MDESAVDVSIIRARVWIKLLWSFNFVGNFISDNPPLLELITMQMYVQPRLIRTP